ATFHHMHPWDTLDDLLVEAASTNAFVFRSTNFLPTYQNFIRPRNEQGKEVGLSRRRSIQQRKLAFEDKEVGLSRCRSIQQRKLAFEVCGTRKNSKLDKETYR
ncbi:29203_t:CDS:2, partial [Gigaspora margarita]